MTDRPPHTTTGDGRRGNLAGQRRRPTPDDALDDQDGGLVAWATVHAVVSDLRENDDSLDVLADILPELLEFVETVEAIDRTDPTLIDDEAREKAQLLRAELERLDLLDPED